MAHHTHAHAGPGHGHSHDHGHSHGLVHASIKRSHAGLRTVALALAVLGLTAAAQAAVYALSGSVALLADLVHNAGDAATAIPLAIAFALRSATAERRAGLAVVAAILLSACVAGVESVVRLLDPSGVDHLGALAARGAHRLRGQRRRRGDPHPRRPAARQRGARRRRRPRAGRRLRLARRRRLGRRRRPRRPDRRPAHRPGDHGADPADHLGVVADGARPRRAGDLTAASPRRESNPQPPAYKADALPVELRGRRG